MYTTSGEIDQIKHIGESKKTGVEGKECYYERLSSAGKRAYKIGMLEKLLEAYAKRTVWKAVGLDLNREKCIAAAKEELERIRNGGKI